MDKDELYLICLWSILALVVLVNLCLLGVVVRLCCKVSTRKVAQFTTDDAI